jgi:hypothetical protein
MSKRAAAPVSKRAATPTEQRSDRMGVKGEKGSNGYVEKHKTTHEEDRKGRCLILCTRDYSGELISIVYKQQSSVYCV